MAHQIRPPVLEHIRRRPRSPAHAAPPRQSRAASVPVEAVTRPDWYPDFPEVIFETT